MFYIAKRGAVRGGVQTSGGRQFDPGYGLLDPARQLTAIDKVLDFFAAGDYVT